MCKFDSSHKSLLDLDDMVLLKIVNHLRLNDVISLGETCKRFANLTHHHLRKRCTTVRWSKHNRHSMRLSESDIIFRNIGEHIRSIDLEMWNEIEFRKILVTLGNECNFLQSLSLHSIRMTSNDRIIGLREQRVSLMFARLEQFTLKECSWTGWCPLELFLDGNSTLEQLTLIDCCPQNENVYKLSLKAFRSLRELHLIQCRGLLTSAELQRCFECNKIVNLSLTNFTTELFVPHLISQLGDYVESLTIDCYNESIDSNQMQKLKRLKKLRILSSNRNNVDKLISRLGIGIEELEVVGILITEPFMEHLESFHRLRHLSFERCSNAISDEFFKMIPKILPNLQHLTYTYGTIRDCDIVHMFRLMPKLKYLSLFGCNPLISDTYMSIVDILMKDLRRPKLKFIPPQMESLKYLMSLDSFRSVLC